MFRKIVDLGIAFIAGYFAKQVITDIKVAKKKIEEEEAENNDK